MLDPNTLVITHTATPADCASTLIKLHGHLYHYQREEGKLQVHGPVDKLTVIRYAHSDIHAALLTPIIFKPVNMYAWEDLRPNGSLNDLMASTAAQAKILRMMTDETDADTTNQMATMIIQRGVQTMTGLIPSPIKYGWR